MHITGLKNTCMDLFFLIGKLSLVAGAPKRHPTSSKILLQIKGLQGLVGQFSLYPPNALDIAGPGPHVSQIKPMLKAYWSLCWANVKQIWIVFWVNFGCM